MVENQHRGGLVRRGGVLTPVQAAWKTRVIDFGQGEAIVEKVLKSQVSPGFRTPSRVYGADLIREIEGVVRSDISG
jgi:hypothetical protein